MLQNTLVHLSHHPSPQTQTCCTGQHMMISMKLAEIVENLDTLCYIVLYYVNSVYEIEFKEPTNVLYVR